MKTRASNDELVIEDGGLFFSSRVIFDGKNRVIHIDTKSFLFFSSSKSASFSQVDRITTNEKCIDAEEDRFESAIILEDQKSQEIFSWYIYNDHCSFSNALFAIYKVMDSEFTERALNNGSVKCKSCSRIISKISEWCIYCGKSKA